MITTPLTELLRIDHPILLAPMGGVAGGRLAAAVSNAGALGLVGGGYADPEWLERELALTGGARVGVGFITFALDERPDSLDLALRAAPCAVQLSFGDPTPYVPRIKDAGALLISQVQTVDEARRAVDAGADVIVAQGQDSGGHGRPGRGTVGLVPAIVDAVGPVPVAAAGGLADGRGLAAALTLGAAGVALGTRFFASAEAISDPRAEDLLIASTGDDTVRTPAFDVVRGPAWPQGYDGRAVRNRLVDRWDATDEGAGAPPRSDLVEAFRAAADDDYSMKPLWAGEGVDLVHDVPPAGTIVRSVMNEAVDALTAASALRRPAPSADLGGDPPCWAHLVDESDDPPG
jgi:nitronate monooxygenase